MTNGGDREIGVLFGALMVVVVGVGMLFATGHASSTAKLQGPKIEMSSR